MFRTKKIYSNTGGTGDVLDFSLVSGSINDSLTWSGITNGYNLSIFGSNTTTISHSSLLSSKSTGKWAELKRSFISFDLNHLGINTNSIVKCEFAFYPVNIDTGITTGSFIFANWKMTNGSDSCSTSDWGDWDTNIGNCNLSRLNTNDYNFVELSLDWIKNKNGGYAGITSLIGSDFNNSEPTWVSGMTELDYSSTDNDTNLPYLKITYSEDKINTENGWKPIIGFKINTENGWKNVIDGKIKITNGNWKPLG